MSVLGHFDAEPIVMMDLDSLLAALHAGKLSRSGQKHPGTDLDHGWFTVIGGVEAAHPRVEKA
jgi:hypothetical protein